MPTPEELAQNIAPSPSNFKTPNNVGQEAVETASPLPPPLITNQANPNVVVAPVAIAATHGQPIQIIPD